MASEHKPRLELDELLLALRHFAQARDWVQFQSPKNLSMAIAAEAGELLAELQWLSEAESGKLQGEKRQAVAFEMADVLMYLLRLADQLDVDILEVAAEKMALNETRYPADKVRGSAKKYSEYSE